jgi:hypothetical protein
MKSKEQLTAEEVVTIMDIGDIADITEEDERLILKLLRIHNRLNLEQSVDAIRIKELESNLASAEAELVRIGYHEPIDVVTADGVCFTSTRGDVAWDTAENRKRVRERYHEMEQIIRELESEVHDLKFEIRGLT